MFKCYTYVYKFKDVRNFVFDTGTRVVCKRQNSELSKTAATNFEDLIYLWIVK